MGLEIKNKSGQVTIFIIIAILIVAAVLIFLFVLNSKTPSTTEKPSENAGSFLDSCLKETLKESIEVIGNHGGTADPLFGKKFVFEDVGATELMYLCYTQNYYEQCSNQQPMLISHVKEEIGDYIEDEINYCWSELGKSFEKEGYVVEAQRIRGYEVELGYNDVKVVIDGVISLTKSGETTREEKFTATLPSKFYEVTRVAQEITSQEATYCSFNHLGYMLTYPEFKIIRTLTSDSVKIYDVEHRETGEKFRFAIRGCVIPPGP